MRLKRLYHPFNAVDKKNPYAPPMVRGVLVLEAGREQNFSPRFIENGVTEGWLTVERGRIIIRGDNQTVTYRIVLPPGYYCCYCNRALDDSPSAQAHIEEAHADEPSPDENNPAGYRRDAFFACVQVN